MTGITLSEGLKEIGLGAFNLCTALTDITIPKSVTEIGDCVFVSCSALENVTILNASTRISGSMFSHCRKLNKIHLGENVTEIVQYAFEDCEGLETIVLPSSIKKIGRGAFKNCTGLKKVIYQGTQSEWYGIEIIRDTNENRPLFEAQLIFEPVESKPVESPVPDEGDSDILTTNPNNSITTAPSDGTSSDVADNGLSNSEPTASRDSVTPSGSVNDAKKKTHWIWIPVVFVGVGGGVAAGLFLLKKFHKNNG